ncbi:MAG: ribose 5-phosphate isomerase B [Rhodospirillales bacterium]|jgi:ribose 5-phosphate isomerase B|nr:ribose 5-phosphate isomerase B [Rhodospirillales bacterium]
MTIKIAIANDHGGLELKQFLKAELIENGFEVLDLGCNSTESVAYPDYGYAIAKAIKNGEAEKGVAICGSGIGISMAANRAPHIRAALIHDALGARLCREHNDANVICFGGRMIGDELARDCLRVFLETRYEGGRHDLRVGKLSTPDFSDNQ